MGRSKTNIKRLVIRVEQELNYNTNNISLFIGKERNMFLTGFITGAMVGGTVAIILHCLVIVGKESEKQWEEEQILKKDKRQEN